MWGPTISFWASSSYHIISYHMILYHIISYHHVLIPAPGGHTSKVIVKWRVVTRCFYFSVHPSANLHSNRVLKRSTLVDVTREVEDGANRQEPRIWSRPWESDFPTSPRYFHHKGFTVTVIVLGGCELKNWNSNSLTPKIQRFLHKTDAYRAYTPPKSTCGSF